MQQINTILIANRGEIASRIIRTCRQMGIKSVAVFSDADRNAPFVEEADTAYFIGESNPSASYLDQNKIIETAKKAGADAIHPGYGFLSENVDFAQLCTDSGVIFIGPHPGAIAAMGSKSAAKELMIAHDVPVVPGYQGKEQDKETLKKVAIDMGFPVLLKATAGGGGKGMRIVHQESETDAAIDSVKREALNAFGNDELIVEKYVPSARHIEFQILGDKHGNAIHVLERECSVQRRYQKVLEETPSPVLSEELRQKMGEAAVKAAKALKYDNAGTVEFILADNGEFYFLEVNTRLQVEHPVTEEVTGLDLVQLQIEIAEGQKLELRQEDIRSKGYAIECRLYAEDAANDFLPVTGKILQWEVLEVDGLRMETAIKSGSEISIYYDPMIAKIIVYGKNRRLAHRKMEYVLRNLVCLGTVTNQEFLLHLFRNQDINQGNYDTHFIKNKIDLSGIGQKDKVQQNKAAIALTLFDWYQRDSKRTLLRSIPSGWRNNSREYQFEDYAIGETDFRVNYRYQKGAFLFKIGEQSYTAKIVEANDILIRFELDGIQETFHIARKGNQCFTHNENIGNVTITSKDRFPAKESEKVKGGYIAPMPSQIVKILVEEGQEVKSGEGLIVLSSMKMENTIEAEEDGTVEAVYTTEGANVEAGFLLVKVKGEE